MNKRHRVIFMKIFNFAIGFETYLQMTYFMRKLILSMLAVLAYFPVMSQAPVAARWSCKAKMLSVKEGEVIMKMNVSDGWHVYGPEIPEGGPRPMRFDLSRSEGVVLTGDPVPSKDPSDEFDKAFGMKVQYWDSPVTFRQKFRLADGARSPKIIGVIEYQGCNGQTCSPPKKQEVNIIVKPFNPAKK